jgi:hypothetical protein
VKIDRANRILFTVIGILLIVAGVCGILLAQGLLPVLEPFQIYARMEEDLITEPAVWWAVIILIGVLVAMLGLWYAVRQVAVRGGRRLDTMLLKRGELGATRLEPDAVGKAVTRDLDRMDGVTGSRVRMRTYLPEPSLAVRLDVSDDADIQLIRSRVDEALERLRRTLGTETVASDVTVRLRPPPPGQPGPRVR